MDELLWFPEVFAPVDRKRRPATLREALCRLNIGIHPKDAVESYKKNFSRKLLAKELFDCTFGLVGSLLGSVVLAAFTGLAWMKVQNPATSIILAIGLGALCASCLCLALVYAVSMYMSTELIRWRSFGISARDMKTEGVPGKARRKAYRLDRNLPGITFEIEWCGNDPFLVARFEDQYEYIAYWDEPEFVER